MKIVQILELQFLTYNIKLLIHSMNVFIVVPELNNIIGLLYLRVSCRPVSKDSRNIYNFQIYLVKTKEDNLEQSASM